MKHFHLIICILLFLLLGCKGETTTVSGIANGNNEAVGTSANDLLSDARYDELIVELAYVQGMRPEPQTISNFKAFLENHLNKPQGVQIVEKPITVTRKNNYTLADIRSIEDTHRTKFNINSRIAIFALCIDGAYTENTSDSTVLGIAYRNTSFVLFEESIQELGSGVFSPSRTTVETTVINHEFGHLLGLVNAGTPMQTNHQDVQHGRHCTTESCLMFWQVETAQGMLDMVSGGNIPQLDSFCLNDLKNNGGK